MALPHVSASLALSINGISSLSLSLSFNIDTPYCVCRWVRYKDYRKSCSVLRASSSEFLKPTGAFFTPGSALSQRSCGQRKLLWKANSGSVRCEQSSQESSSVDVWVGRVAMVSFTLAITAEITTGKGLLENFGLRTPLPTVALAVTALVVALFALFITQSASKN